MADSLEVEVMALRFTPVVERTIEREHLPLNRAARHKATRRGAVLSGAARASEIMQRLRLQQHNFLKELTCKCTLIQDAKSVIKLLGLMRRPAVVKVTSTPNLWRSGYI